jgi:hypothetical protein
MWANSFCDWCPSPEWCGQYNTCGRMQHAFGQGMKYGQPMIDACKQHVEALYIMALEAAL